MSKNCKPNVVVPDKYSVIIVQNIAERDDISCKLRQNGTIAIVVEEGYAQYQIQTQEGFYGVCDNNAWVQIETGDKVFDGNNLIILNDETHKQEYLHSPFAKVGQMIYFVPEQKYYTYNGIGLGDPFPNKLGKPLDLTINPDNKLIPVYGQSGDNPEWLPSNTLGKVESVNNVGVSPGTKNIELKLSNIPDDVGYATDAELTQLSKELDVRITQVEGINYTWNPTNRTLTLFDTSGRQMSQVSLVSLDNEGTDLRYNSTSKSLELYNADNQLLDSIPISDFVGNVGTALQLNSNVLQLKDSQGNIFSSVSFSISNISGLQTALDTKLDKTTTTVAAPDATFKYVYLTDETNNVRRMLAGDLGKNVANSFLTSVAGAGLTLGSSWTLNTNGQLYGITNLPDKSADASFNKMMVQNSTGQVAWGNGKTLIKNMPALLSDVEKTTWRNGMRLSTESYSVGTPRIDSVILPVIDNSLTYIQYVTLIGLNLFVDNQTPNAQLIMKRVKDVNGSILPIPEVYNITNFSVLQTSPNMLNFGLNWSAYPQGYYKFFCTHNLLTNTTSPELLVKSKLRFSQLNPVWQDLTGSAYVDSNNRIVLGVNSSARTNILLDTPDMINGFIVKFSIEMTANSIGPDHPGHIRFTLKGDDGLEYGIQSSNFYSLNFYPEVEPSNFTIKTDVIYISYYNGFLTLTAEVNGKAKVFSSTTIPAVPRYFYGVRGGGGAGGISAKPTQVLIF